MQCTVQPRQVVGETRDCTTLVAKVESLSPTTTQSAVGSSHTTHYAILEAKLRARASKLFNGQMDKLKIFQGMSKSTQ